MFLVVGECGSYYCNGLHPVGVFHDRGAAEQAAARIGEVEHDDYGPLVAGRVLEIPVDAASLNDARRLGCH